MDLPFRASIRALLVLGMTTISSYAAEVYSGEPLAEALFDLAGKATLISHEGAAASGLTRTDVFRLRDGCLLAITSHSDKMGEPYRIEVLRVTSSSKEKLSKKIPAVANVKIPNDH